MKLISFARAGQESYGTVTDSGVVDIGRRLGSRYGDLRALIADSDEGATRFYVEWSSYDLKLGDQLRCEENSRELAKILADEGFVVVTNEVADGAGWGSWRARTDLILETFFPVTD